MFRRIALILAALLLLIIGGGVTYLALSAPNDLRAEEVLKRAKADYEAGERSRARESLQVVVQQYPRTDAAAAALHMLFRMAEQDRVRLENDLRTLTRQRESDRKRIEQMALELADTSERTSKAIAEAEAAKKLAAAKPPPVKQRITVKKSASRKAPVRATKRPR